MTEIIQKLLKLGWEPAPYTHPDEDDFYVRKEFEVSQAKELYSYTDYTPVAGEKIFLVYEIYPNRKVARWCIWREQDNPTEAPWIEDDYNATLELALEDRLFTYPHWIEVIAQEKGITLSQWAKKSNLHHSVLYRIVDRNTAPEGLQVATAEALAKGIGMTLDEFLEYAKNKKTDG